MRRFAQDPRTKQVLLVTGFVLGAVGLVELSAFATYALMTARAFSFTEVRTEQRERFRGVPIDGSAAAHEARLEALHPYLGYVYNPDANRDALTAFHGFPISSYGFLDDRGPIRTKSPDRLLVGMLGGSFASLFSASEGLERLREALEQAPAYAGRKLDVVRVALGGYKQPQQLMALNYLLALGGQFDVVVNLDGFNEVTLPPTDNLSKGVFPFYPRTWFSTTTALPSPALQDHWADVRAIRRRQRWCARLISETPLRYSVTLNLLWAWYDQRLTRAAVRHQVAMLRESVPPQRYQTTGPPNSYQDESALYRDLAAMWQRSSLLLHRLCQANGIVYFHFLQPNQYVPGSKTMSREERRLAFSPDHLYRRAVEHGYPELRKAGHALSEAGVNFHDLTMIFADVEEPVYADDCCHLNPRGYQIVGTAMGQAILQSLQAALGPGDE